MPTQQGLLLGTFTSPVYRTSCTEPAGQIPDPKLILGRCPLESPTARRKTPYTASFDHTLFESLSLHDPPAPAFTRPVPPECPFLALPGEIRNRIYQFALVTAKPFAVQLQWNRPLDAALLQVNRQIFDEASSIFYAENMFRFPEALFVGAPILQQLQTLYRVSRPTLMMMRSVVLDVPVWTALRLLRKSILNFNRANTHRVGVRLHIQPALSHSDFIEPSTSDRDLGSCSKNEGAVAVGVCVWRKRSVSRTRRVSWYLGRRCPQSAVEWGGYGCAYQDASEVHGRMG